MLTKQEASSLKIIIPLWIVGCVVLATWLTMRAPTPALAPTEPIANVEQAPTEAPSRVTKPAFATFIEITGGCGPSVDAYCAAVYSTPEHTSTVVTQLREGVVLEVKDATTTASGVWYEITFNEWLRYPERVSGRWFVPRSELTRVFIATKSEELLPTSEKPLGKYIVVDRSEQMLYAYENDTLVMTQTISTGILATPTPRGTFTIYKKTPSRYMQGPLPGISTKHYDLPGVPWNLYFTEQGGVIHGAYWHDQFGKPWSNGCVNMPRGRAEELYHWADIGTTVFVRD